MSFVEPNFGQSQQNKKIVQELEEKKRRMRSAIGIFDCAYKSFIKF